MITKTIKRAFLILILVCLNLVSCDKDSVIEPTEIVKTKKFKTISFEQFETSISNYDMLQDFKSNLDINVLNKSSQRKSVDEGAVILTDYIIAVQLEDETHYTFKILLDSENNSFYNLVVFVNNEGEITNSQILEYIPSSSWIIDPAQPFSGYVKMYDNSSFSEGELGDIINARGGRCLIGVTTEWECNAGNDHSPNTCTAGGSDLIVNLEYGPCPETIEAGDNDSGLPIDANNGGGGGGSGVNGSTTPLPPCEFVVESTDDQECLSIQDYNLALELNTILGPGESYEFDDSLGIDEYLSFDSVSEFEDWLSNNEAIEASIAAINLINGSTRIDDYDFIIDAFFNTVLRVNVKSEIPDLNSEECMQTEAVESYLHGNTSIATWTQDAFFTATPRPDLDRYVIEFGGALRIGININGITTPFNFTQIKHIIISYGYSSTQPEHHWMYDD